MKPLLLPFHLGFVVSLLFTAALSADDDACGDEPDNRTTGEFTVSERGSQSYKPDDHWRFTVRWHLK